MRVLKAVRDFARDGDGIGHGELLLAIQPVAQRLAFDVRHGEPEASVHGAGIEDAEDVRMLEPRSELDFLLEAVSTQARGYLVVQHLERHGPVVPEIVGQVDDGKATPSEHALESIPVGEGGFQSGLVGQVWSL